KYREASEARFERIEAALAQLTEAQRRTEEEFRKYREASEARFERIEAALAQLAEAQRRTEEQLLHLRELTLQQIQALREAVEALRDWQKSAEDKLARLDGFYLEYTYERKAPAILGEVLHKVRVVPRDRLEEYVKNLSRQEVLDLLRTDIIVRGRVWDAPGDPEVWAAVEVSAVVDERDVTRAARRASLLRRAGYTAIPIVAGRQLTKEASQVAAIEHVVVLTDGISRFWREALTAAGIELPPDWLAPEEPQQGSGSGA
ncbi:MAG: hypothetical protein N3B68_08160, partial [Anaerolineae bacterium]|nr:hypothetical protein [Anaerolineae bacterium]